MRQVQGIIYRQNNLVVGWGFLYKIKGPHLCRLHSRFNGPMTGDHDNRQTGMVFLDFFQCLKPIHTWHPDIKQDHVNPLLFNDRKALFRRPGADRHKPFIRQNSLHGFQDTGFIVNNKNF